MPETTQPNPELIQEAREIFGKRAVSLAMEIVEISDADGAYSMLQDQGEEDAADAVEFLYFA